MNTIFNTGETQEDLRNTYNPDGSTLRKSQLRMLDMAVYLFDAAKEAGVGCRLESGNILGALRHGGYIPWDDDFDVTLQRKDYKTLIDYITNHPHPQYVLQTPETDDTFVPWARLRDLKSEYLSPYPEGSRDDIAYKSQKLRGLQIDIFTTEEYMIPWLQRLAAKMSCVVAFDFSRINKPLAQFSFKTLQYIVYPLFRLIGRCFGRKDYYMFSYGTWFYEQFPQKVLLPYKDLIFEGHSFPGPADAHEFCRIMYGDYMNLPPKDKRTVHNSGILIED